VARARRRNGENDNGLFSFDGASMAINGGIKQNGVDVETMRGSACLVGVGGGDVTFLPYKR